MYKGRKQEEPEFEEEEITEEEITEEEGKGENETWMKQISQKLDLILKGQNQEQKSPPAGSVQIPVPPPPAEEEEEQPEEEEQQPPKSKTRAILDRWL